MARHHLINNDLELFLTVDAKEFKKKISKRVFSPWHNRSNDNWLRLSHMILNHVITSQKTDKAIAYDWKAILSKLTDAGYVFTSDDYFPDNRGRHVYFNIDGQFSNFDMVKESSYLEMIKELHLGGVVINEKALTKFIKSSRSLDADVTEFFSSVGFNLETVLLETSINTDIETLINDNYDNVILKGSSNDRVRKYQQEQLLKADRIKSYLENTVLSYERAKEIYDCFDVSFPKMETYPEFNGRYLSDICCFYHCANELKTEAFFMDIQVDLIKLLEEKSDIKFLQEHAVGSHRRIGETAGKKNHWEL